MTAISKEYASALFEFSLELGKIDAVSEAVDTLTAAFKEDPEYIDFLACYGIPVKERVEAVGTALADIDGTALSFVQLVIEQGQIGNFLLVLALSHVEASVQYPMVTGGVMIVCTLLGLLVGEKPPKRELFAVLVAFLSLLLLWVIRT